METFQREGRNSQEGRRRFYDGGGFCRRHGWLFHQVCVERGSGTAIAAVYSALAKRDLQLLDQVENELIRVRTRRSPSLARAAECSACTAVAERLERRAYFFVQMLRRRAAMERYRRSDGMCFDHLVAIVDVAVGEDREVALFLVRDWQPRLADVRAQLAEFDRKRDHQFAAEPKGAEQHSWTDVIVRYVGADGT